MSEVWERAKSSCVSHESHNLHVVGELFEDPPVLAAQRKVDWFDLQEVMTSLKLGSGEGYSGAVADPMSGDLPDAVGDVL